MNSLGQQVLGGAIVVLLAAGVRYIERARKDVNDLKTTVATLVGEVVTLKEFWMRTAERRDTVVREAERWKNYALKIQGVDPKLLELPVPPAEAPRDPGAR